MTALGLLLGGRASPELVRTGAKEAVVEGIFELEGEAPLPELADWISAEEPREVVIRRVIAEGGRSRITINDNAATVQGLARLGAALVQIYGQHEQQSLTQRENHQQILDRHAGLEHDLAEYHALYQQTLDQRARLAALEQRERERADLLELARFRVRELEQAELAEGEEESLTSTRTVLANATKLAEAADAAEQVLYAGERAAVDIVAGAYQRLSEAAQIDPSLAPTMELIAAARANLEEAAHSIRVYAARLEADPSRLEQVETRLQELVRLKRKYGGSITAAIETLAEARREIAELEALAESRAEAAAELERSLDELLARAQKMSARRERGSVELKRRSEAELRTLGMRNVAFEARVSRATDNGTGLAHGGIALGATGIDVVEFLFSPNLGQPPLPLGRTASGGELSRVMLALKRLEAQRRGVATMIFDEVDAGIGGAVAEIVGRKLKELARYHQILCVTHLAQIAVFADRHFVVEKEERRGATRSRVVELKTTNRPAEVARMLGGDEANDKFIRAARELIERARA
jgi:DNA repair protein RecN (Recombination protein N)